jgi:opacity protein-like surface antigen
LKLLSRAVHSADGNVPPSIFQQCWRNEAMTHRIETALLAAFLAAGPAIASAADDAHWYATANLGANFMSDQSVSLSGDGPTQSGEASLSNGMLAGAAVGRAFSRSFRAEAEFVYQSVDHDGVRLADGGSLPSGNYASTGVALNGLYSFNLFGREEVRTYVGLGLAWLTEVDIDFEQGGEELSYSGDGFGVQLLAGARYEIGERWFLDAGLRYLSAGEVTMDGEGAATGRVRADYEPWSATLGIGWRF